METKTVIIAVVIGVVGLVLVVLTGLWLRRRLAPANPLPPVQPLAHHRAPIHRPLSASSSRSTIYSKSSRQNLRGTPHGPHSQTPIVLPAPLSQELLLDPDRRSAADSWVSPGTTPRELRILLTPSIYNKFPALVPDPPSVPRILYNDVI